MRTGTASAGTAVLKRKLQKDQPKTLGILTAEETAAMKELQNRLILLPVLALQYAEGYFTIDTDTSSVQLGCVLLQRQPVKTTKPVRYWSQSLRKH